MRVYFVRLTQADFSESDGVWTGPSIDLYSNSSYQNYSSTKSKYGTDLLGNGTWTGFDNSVGFVAGDRFVDTTGRIDVISYEIETVDEVDGQLSVYTAADPDLFFPDEWLEHGTFRFNEDVELIDSPRWFRPVLHLDTPTDFVVYIRVEIDVPVMAPWYSSVQELQRQFPEWMELREQYNTGATPESLAGKLLTAIAGQWIEDFNEKITYLDLQGYIDTVDLNQPAWAYKSTNLPQYAVYIAGDGVELTRSYDLREFYESDPDEHTCFWNEESDILYTNREYDNLIVDTQSPPSATPPVLLQEPHHIWNSLDDIGLLVGLHRLQLESNENFRLRVLDVHRNRPGVGTEAFKKAVRRELNMWSVYGATPDSEYLGATPEILEISDIEKDEEYFGPDGMPTRKFIGLVDHLSREYPITWGRFRWGRAMWDITGKKYEGVSLVPNLMDATPLPDHHTQSGVGDYTDLFVYRPEVITGPNEFTARLTMRGKERSTRTEYPAVSFSLVAYGEADKVIYDNPEKTIWLTVEITTLDDEVYYHSFQISSTSDVSASNPTATPSSYGVYEFFNNYTETNPDIVFAKKTTDAPYVPDDDALTDGQIPVEDIKSVYLHNGAWNVGTQAYGLREGVDTIDTIVGSNSFSAFFSDDPDSVLTYNSAAVGYENDLATPALLATPYVVMSSKVVQSTTERWQSIQIPIEIQQINGLNPPTTSETIEIEIPDIPWDPDLHATPNAELVLELVSIDTEGNGVAQFEDDTGETIFLDDSFILVDGDGTWVDNKKVYADAIDSAPESIVFSVREDYPTYPIEATVWNLFERTQISDYEGVVDENGPWRNGEAPVEGNSNFLWQTVNVAREDFNLPDTDTYVVTWMGAEVLDNPRVTVWLDTNTVHPAVESGQFDYPDNAIQEVYDPDVSEYYFEPINVYAKISADPSPQWHPQVNSGWFYQRQQEHYFYADKASENITGNDVVLNEVVRQGAPIIITTNEATPQLLRQVAFYETDPLSLSLTNTETVSGSGTTELYLSYPNLHSVSVTDANGESVALVSDSTETNRISATGITDRDEDYTATYILASSFYADNDFENEDGELRTRIVTDGATNAEYIVYYEKSLLNPATPVDLPLNPLFTTMNEGFIFISHDEDAISHVEVFLSPTTVVADGQDFIVISLRSVDEHGNPKPSQVFTVSSDYGTVDPSEITTDSDGFAFTTLTSEVGTTTLVGTITITGPVGASVPFDIDPAYLSEHRIIAAPGAEQIPADGTSRNVVYGKIEDAQFEGVPYAVVHWKKARSIYELFLPTENDANEYGFEGYGEKSYSSNAPEGRVVANADGMFTIGPAKFFTAATPDEPGYWFVVVRSESANPSDDIGATPSLEFDEVGDIVFWNEYPVLDALEEFSGIPLPPVQQATPPGTLPAYSDHRQFPYNYDEATPYAEATPVYGTDKLNWLPPRWYAISKYLQYQLGILGEDRNTVDIDTLDRAHKFLKDI